MKKLTVLFVSCAFSLCALAQIKSVPSVLKAVEKKNNNLPMVPINNNVDNSTKATIWSNDFSNPATWVFSNDVGNSDNWKIDTIGPQGAYSIGKINSTTKTNGFATFDSDFLCSGDQIAHLTTATSINCSGYPSVALEFQQYYRRYYDSTFIYVSTDGTTWAKFVVNQSLAVNAMTFNPINISINISSVAANQATVWIRFTFYSPSSLQPGYSGCGYAWMIDDVKLIEVYNNDIVLQKIYPVFNGAGFYSMTPKAQTMNVYFGADVFNNGNSTQTNVALNVEVKHYGTSEYNQTSTPLALLASQATDSLGIATPFTPPADTALYTTIFNVTQTQVDENPANNKDTLYFLTTDTIFARDYYLSTMVSPQSYTGAADGDFIGNWYYFTNAATVKSITVYISSLTTAGTSVIAKLYNENLTQIVASAPHTITTGEIGNFITIPFTTATNISGGEFYLAGLECYWGTNDLYFGGDNMGPHDYPNSTWVRLDTSWYYTTTVALIRLNIAPSPITDVGVIAITEPAYDDCQMGNEQIKIKIKNFGTNPISNFTVKYKVNAQTPVSQNVPTTIAAGDTLDFTFTQTANLSAVGVYNISAWTELSGDANNNNDTAYITVEHTAPATVPYSMGFELTEDYSDWAVEDANNDYTTWHVYNGGAHTGSYCASYRWSYINPANDWLFSKCIQLNAGTNYNISFWYKVASSSYPEKLKLNIGTAQSASAMTTLLIDLDTITNTTYLQVDTNFTVPSSGIYYFGWHAYSNADMWRIYLDDINITASGTVCTANAGPDVAICQGQSTVLNATGGFTYSWSPTTGLNDPNVANPTANPTTSTVYVVTITDVYGCTDKDTVIVYVNNLPAVNFTGLSAEYCLNDVAANLTGSPLGGTFSGNGITGNYFNPTNAGVGTHFITYNYTDANGCTNTDVDTTTVKSIPVITGTATITNSSCGTATGSITGLSATGTPPITYAWTDAGGNTVGTNANLTNAYAGTYTLTVTAGNGCSVKSGHYTINNIDAPPAPTATSPAPYCSGETIAPLTATGTGGTLIWYSDYQLTNPIDTGSPFLPEPVPTTTTTYYVAEMGACLSAATPVTITIYPLPTADAGPDVSICAGQSTQLAGSGGYTYQWSPATGLNNINISNPIASPTTTTTYTLTVTDIYGCTDTNQMTVTVNPLPVVNLGQDDTIFTTQSITLNAGNPGATYYWLPTGETTQTITVNGSVVGEGVHTYTVTVTNAFGCSNSDSITITVLFGTDTKETIYTITQTNVNLYPNPNNGLVYLQIENAEQNELFVEITNITGQVVYKIQKPCMKFSRCVEVIDFTNQAKGMYFVKVFNNDIMKVMKLVIE